MLYTLHPRQTVIENIDNAVAKNVVKYVSTKSGGSNHGYQQTYSESWGELYLLHSSGYAKRMIDSDLFDMTIFKRR